ncbi:BrnT family toxin [Teredinibacter franksiae]|uniref:BrnT family toxin n=1 Tax=Teredinibacter franksiae TaxID=2761453 RepID=UPI001C8A1DF8|nr:BrnT family toxin [Teredinibacter franksiae]
MQYNFEWDPTKAQTNTSKHGVTFEQATGVFRDPMALTVFDSDGSSEGEDRWVTLG